MADRRKSITAIVAATMNNGIGVNGGLPWRLPGEMKYFARVTTGEQPYENPKKQNTVIMGRKTWESIPDKFRPLKNRRNLIISSNKHSINLSPDVHPNTALYTSLSSAISSSESSEQGRTFIIGGSTIYTSSLSPPNPIVNRILLTRIISPDYPCDAFLEDFQSHTHPETGKKLWVKASLDELREWIGWDVQEENEEKGVKYRYEMWVLNK